MPTTIVAVVTDRGRSLPGRWSIDGRSGELVSGPPEPGEPWADATTHAIAHAGGGRVLVLGTLGGRAMELMSVGADVLGGDAPMRPEWTTHTRLGSAWQREVRPAADGLHRGRPGRPGRSRRGSPRRPNRPAKHSRRSSTSTAVRSAAGRRRPHVEVIVLTGAGYRVVLPNIRGSTGYGADWIRPQLGDWGGVDALDVHAAVDHVIELGLADPDRLGVLGLSYGGFLVNWLVGTTDRFAAAVSENGVSNQVSAWANSDGGPECCRMALIGDPLSADGVDRLWRQSPLRNVAAVRTPLLMLQAESDLRCPAQDNEQFFVALRQLGRTVEYVLYPDESHVFAAAGRPDRRIDRMQRVLEWFARYLRAGL